jgi:hypothetical protein
MAKQEEQVEELTSPQQMTSPEIWFGTLPKVLFAKPKFEVELVALVLRLFKRIWRLESYALFAAKSPVERHNMYSI